MVHRTHLNLNSQLFVPSESIFVGQRQQPDLIQGIRSVGDQLPQEDLWEKIQNVRGLPSSK